MELREENAHLGGIFGGVDRGVGVEGALEEFATGEGFTPEVVEVGEVDGVAGWEKGALDEE